MGLDFPPVQTGPGAHPASCTMGTGSFPGVKYGRCVLLTTHPLLVPRSWKSRAISLTILWATTGPVTGKFYLYMQYTALLITASIPLFLPADTRHASWHKGQTLSRRLDDKLVCRAGIFCAENKRSIDDDSALPRSLTSLLVTTAADLICPVFERSQYSHTHLLCYSGVQHDESQPPRLWLSLRYSFVQTSAYMRWPATRRCPPTQHLSVSSLFRSQAAIFKC